MDDPGEILKEAIDNHRQMIKQFKGQSGITNANTSTYVHTHVLYGLESSISQLCVMAHKAGDEPCLDSQTYKMECRIVASYNYVYAACLSPHPYQKFRDTML